MTATAASAVTHHRPAAVLTTIGVLVFLGISAFGGGVALVFSLGSAAPPQSWLDKIPLVDSWTMPGLVLGLGFGVGSLIVAYGVTRRPHWAWLDVVERPTRHHWSWIATILIGLGQVVWITLELFYLPELSALQAVYGVVGVALLLLPLLAPVRAYLRTDSR